MRRPFLLVSILLVAGGLLGALVIWSGIVDVSATAAGGLPDKVLGYAATRSIRHHAKDEKNPLASDPAALRRGMEHYRAMCVACHGGPGAEPQEFAAGLHPTAPDLASPDIQAFTDGMLYRTIEGGIGSTGMPAFGQSHDKEELWSIVAFVRHLPALTPQEKAELGNAQPGHAHAEAPAQPTPPPAADAGNPAPPGANAHRVTISNFKFDPAELHVHAGDVVEWVNTDFAAHTATADDKSFDTKKIDGSASARVVMSKKGSFPYFCRYHLAMRGTVVVE